MLRTSIIGPPTEPIKNKNLQLDPEMKIFKEEPMKRERTSKMIQQFIKKIEEGYSNKDSQNKSKMVKSYIDLLEIVRAILSGIVIFLGLCTYEFWSPVSSDRPGPLLLIHIFMFCVTIAQVTLYIFTIYLNGLYLKYMNIIPKRINMFYYFGPVKISIQSILYLVQPLYFSTFRVAAFTETFWDHANFEIAYFDRQFNDYLLLVQFTFNFWHLFYVLLNQSKWSSRKSNIRCRKFGTTNSFHFMLVSLSVDQPFLFTICVFVMLWIFYSVVIRITESGIYRSVMPGDYATFDEYLVAASAQSTLISYAVCFWYVFVSMSTIGYGDMYVNSTLGRIWVVFVVLTGIVVVSILVVVYGNFFNFSKNERLSYNFYNTLLYKESMKTIAAKMIINGYRMRKSVVENQYNQYLAYRSLMIRYGEQMKLIRYEYNQSRSGNDHMRNLFIKIDDTCDTLIKDIEVTHPGLKAYIEKHTRSKKN